MTSSKRRARIVRDIVAATLVQGCMAGSQSARGEVRIGADGIGGTVTSVRGAEAGVRVIAANRWSSTFRYGPRRWPIDPPMQALSALTSNHFTDACEVCADFDMGNCAYRLVFAILCR